MNKSVFVPDHRSPVFSGTQNLPTCCNLLRFPNHTVENHRFSYTTDSLAHHIHLVQHYYKIQVVNLIPKISEVHYHCIFLKPTWLFSDTLILYDSWGFYGGKFVVVGLLGLNAVWTRKWILRFRWNTLSLSARRPTWRLLIYVLPVELGEVQVKNLKTSKLMKVRKLIRI